MHPELTVADLIFNTPLAVSPAKLDVVLSVLAQRLNIVSVNGFDFTRAMHENEPDTQAASGKQSQGFQDIGNGVALINISGSLMHRTRGLDAMSGLASYKSLSSSFAAAMNDESVLHTVLHMDTPGGQTNGLPDFVDEIFSARGIKPITAIVDDSAFSAGMWIAAAADEIVVSRTGGVGSIGVLGVHTDRSQMLADNGVKVTLVTSGKKKAMLADTQPLSSDGLEFLQALVDEQASMFIDSVASMMGLSTKAVREQEAGVFFGAKAVQAGLAHRVQPADQALRDIVARYAPNRNAPTANLKQPGRIARAAQAMRIASA